MNTYTFRVIIEPDERNTFHAFVPTLPGCHTWAETIEEARKNVREAISVYLMSMQADGEEIPQEQGFEVVEIVPAPIVPRRRRNLVYA